MSFVVQVIFPPKFGIADHPQLLNNEVVRYVSRNEAQAWADYCRDDNSKLRYEVREVPEPPNWAGPTQGSIPMTFPEAAETLLMWIAQVQK